MANSIFKTSMRTDLCGEIKKGLRKVDFYRSQRFFGHGTISFRPQ